MNFGHAFTSELLQVIASLLAVPLNISLYVQAREDRKFLRTASMNGVRMMVAENHVRQELYRMCLQLLLLVVGILMVALPPPPPVDPTLSLLINRYTLTTVTIVLALKSWLDRHDRVRLIQMLAQEAHKNRRRITDKPEGE